MEEGAKWPGDPTPMKADDPRPNYVGDPPGWMNEKVEEGTIKFKAHVWKVGSLGGGGLRVQLNLDQAYIRQMAMLAECQHDPEMELEFEARQSREE